MANAAGFCLDPEPGSAFVDGLWGFDDGLHRDPGAIAQHPIEAMMPPGVAGDAAGLLDGQQDDILVAIQPYLQHLLPVAGFLALAPEFLAGTGPVAGVAFGEGQIGWGDDRIPNKNASIKSIGFAPFTQIPLLTWHLNSVAHFQQSCGLALD